MVRILCFSPPSYGPPRMCRAFGGDSGSSKPLSLDSPVLPRRMLGHTCIPYAPVRTRCFGSPVPFHPPQSPIPSHPRRRPVRRPKTVSRCGTGRSGAQPEERYVEIFLYSERPNKLRFKKAAGAFWRILAILRRVDTSVRVVQGFLGPEKGGRFGRRWLGSFGVVLGCFQRFAWRNPPKPWIPW